MYDALLRPDATDSDWINASLKFEWFDSWDRWRYDNGQETGGEYAWDYRRQFHDAGTDRNGENYFTEEDWAYSEGREFGPLDALILTAMGHDRNRGWPAPVELDALFGALDARETLRQLENRARCNRWAGEVVNEIFRDAQKTARANPQWFANEEWAASAPAIQKVTDSRPLPPAGVMIDFVQVVDAFEEKDAWNTAMEDFDERTRARSMTLSQEVQRGCAKMDRMTGYVCNVRGEPEQNNPDNVYFLLRSIDCEVRWNAWLERMEIKGSSPFAEPHLRWPEWTYVDDSIVAMIRTFAARTHSRFCPGKDFTWDSLLTLARKNTVDPALDRLADLEVKWDGAERLNTWLSHACSVPADAYHAAVGRNVLGGMVKRIRKPGAKHDEIALLVGPEGTGKSTMIAALAPLHEWFTESVRLGDEPKELVLSLAGKAVAEISEMSASTKDVAAIKAMISRTTDAGRTAYARAVTERPRRNIFIASTNDETALIADTGNRRFLPVKVETTINLEWLRANIGQLIGEAAALESDGETFGLPRSVWGDASERQEASRQIAEYEMHLNEWFAPTPLGIFVTAADLSELVKAAAGRSVNSKNYTKAMRRLDFVKASRRVDGKPAAVWHRGDLATATRVVPQQIGGRLVARLWQLPPESAIPPLPAVRV